MAAPLQEPRVIVIGAGPAGLLAAIRAASLGAPVLLLEKMPAPGRKLLITGSGRCNMTNAADVRQFIEQYHGQGRFLYPAFRRFFRPELLEFFAAQGISFITEPSGKIFPASNKSSDILDALLKRTRDLGVSILTNQKVLEILVQDGRISGVKTVQAEYRATAVVLAAGGKSWPSTGSTGDGYPLAAKLGHRLTAIRPGLVPFEIEVPWVRDLSGLSCPDVRAVLLKGGSIVGRSAGELLWTHFGLSGPSILRLSRAMIPDNPEALRSFFEIQLDLLPGCQEADLYTALKSCVSAKPRHFLKNALESCGILPKALMLALLNACQIPGELFCAQASHQQLKNLAATIKRLVLPVARTRGYGESMVTAGGIDLGEVDPQTMASRLIEGLYLAGEILDLDGDTGGYNLQAAFSTGFLAGENAARFCSSGLKSEN